MREFTFNTAYMQAKELYGLELIPDEFESLGLIAWNKIGNSEYKLYHYTVIPSVDAMNYWYVDLPCNVSQIEAVTTNYEDYQKTSPTTLAGDNQNGWIEGYIESRKYNTGTLYSSGKYIKYRQEGHRIILSDRFDVVHIFYKGIIVDDTGLPLLNNQEMDAIAAFCIFISTRKQALISQNNALWSQVQYLEQNWKNLCSQARIPDFINQNEMDEILNAATSWDRKRFGKSFKPWR